MNPEQGLQIQDLGGVLRRRQGTMAVVAGAVFLIAIVTAALLPNRYAAWTTLLVEPQSISKGLIESTLEESELEGRLHLMTMQILSRGRLSRVITELELYPEESQEMTREEVISLMRSHIRVEPVLPELEVDGQEAPAATSRSTPSASTTTAIPRPPPRRWPTASPTTSSTST